MLASERYCMEGLDDFDIGFRSTDANSDLDDRVSPERMSIMSHRVLKILCRKEGCSKFI